MDNVLIVGSKGQLGTALRQLYPNGTFVDKEELDVTDQAAVENFSLDGIQAIINAAAFTNVDACELPENQELVEAVNVTAVAALANKAYEAKIPFVHISTDYVFDGTKSSPYTETDEVSPVSVYGRGKVASEGAAYAAGKHYVIRTSWVIGEGQNFVRTMLMLAEKGINPSVVSDQFGRPTFTKTLAAAIKHLLDTGADYGTYNVSNTGKPVSWADLAQEIFTLANKNNTVTPITTKEYFKDKPEAASRPYNSVFNLSKIQATGFAPSDWHEELKVYILSEVNRQGA